MRSAETLRSFALAAAAQGKPVVAYKLGRSSAARELAISHTGALAGEDDVADAFLADCGIARVDTFEGLIESLPLVARMPIRKVGEKPATVAVVTTTAGGAAMVVDRLGAGGVRIEGPGAETLARFKAAKIEVVPGRLIDLTIAGARYETMKTTLDILTTAPEYDLVVAVVGSSARFHPDLAVRPIVDSANAPKPIAAFLVPDAPEALARLSAAGVPSFRTPEACADAVIAALGRRPPKAIVAPSQASQSTGRVLDELEAGALLDRLGVPRAPSVALDAGITQAPALPFPYPVVVKLLSAEITHKTEVGGVVLDVRDGGALLAAFRTIRDAVGKHGTRLDRVLVQPMLSGVGEVLIGYRVDPDVGPLVLMAAGGVQTEIYKDRSLRLAPVDLPTARTMLDEVSGMQALKGFRGRPPGDLDALAQAIVAFSGLATLDQPVAEAEMNPVIVRPVGQGVAAVDALVRLA
jgi:acyl-CoA synthetase (NDP forming)